MQRPGLVYGQTKDSTVNPGIRIMYHTEMTCDVAQIWSFAAGGKLKRQTARDGRIQLICNESIRPLEGDIASSGPRKSGRATNYWGPPSKAAAWEARITTGAPCLR